MKKKRKGDRSRRDCYAYLDIETTGFSSRCSDLTVVGVALMEGARHQFGQLFGEHITADKVLRLLEGADRIYTYNGSGFDLPFIEGSLGLDLCRHFSHKDLKFDCWDKGLKGGLKEVERKLGIERTLADVDGQMAVQLWWDYVNNHNLEALRMLLEYNKEDVMNLHILREKLGVN
jgi:hypothetical protein